MASRTKDWSKPFPWEFSSQGVSLTHPPDLAAHSWSLSSDAETRSLSQTCTPGAAPASSGSIPTFPTGSGLCVCVCVCVCVYVRERETERERDRETEIQRQRDRETEGEKEKDQKDSPFSLISFAPCRGGILEDSFLFLFWCTEILCNESFTQGPGELGALA